ncbi:ThuA domain-containing protein [Lacihabitans soyangensis]|uniref:Cytochrome C n=1 Tax=Lacihabitans soyangensis TaxID=869394 RepID=A0AAE3H2M9_9BACT|nr:ThuA domain-containing protein [Lacihabitans soyangensis]MCP9763653.1 cytochrome C [Lacihabitans soyangensis]
MKNNVFDTIRRVLVSVFLLFFVNGLFAQTKVNVLVFSKTAAFRHQSIEAGKTALAKMAKEKGFGVSFTEDAAQFTELNLKKFNTVIFLNTTGDILNNEQQNAFERYIQAGGGYVGIHAATDTEYEWPWYNQLAGAWFLDHPMPNNVQKGRFYVTQKNEFTAGMPDSFERSDEFYAFKDISPKINVVLKIDEKSYTGGKNGDNHPMSWYQEFQGGRSFYTAMGHTDETFSEPLFLNHLYAGIKYTTGGDAPKPLDFSKARPEENRFTKVVLEEKLDEPVELSVLDKDRVLFIQRKGEVRLYNSKTKTLKTIAKLPVSLKYVNKEGKESVAEDGLLGLNKDPKFAQNQWIYLYYSSTKGSYNVLSRFTMKGDEIHLDSEKEMLKVETQREECCHTGGSIDWDKQGNLYLSTGDNTNPHASNGYSPSDERPGRSPWDAQKSSANTNDLRGKILRIKPNADGTYSIPSGNLFSPLAPSGGKYSASLAPPSGAGGATRPEIYTMGHRNPYRISVDPKNSKLYWGDVGPDASKADPKRGPDGTCEFGQAAAPGNYGWPHFVGDNKAYNKFDFASNTSGDKWDYLKPINTSPNNTGLTLLPEAKGAMLWYGYGASKEFPLLGAGGCNPMAGPVYYKDMFATAPRAFPKYYDGKFFAYEWMRGWVMAVSFDKDGNYASMERFMPSYKFSNPMDMEFAENGDLYMLEYGSGWFTANDDARLIRIEYNGFNRKPQIQVAANQMGGAIPFNLKLSAKGTSDADGDPLKYSWKITSNNGFVKVIPAQDANITLTTAGVYKATLTVNDGKGGINSQSMEITAGNEPPILSLDMPKANKSFYIANKSFDYEIKVKDKEDGDLDNGISPENVAVNIDYLAEGYDKNMIAMGHRSADEGAAFAKGKKLIEASDCMACHKKDSKSIGPSYRDVSVKYKGDSKALETLTKKILSGGSGVWGETAMAAHPQISTADASEMVKYILNISNEKPKSSLPVKGTFTTKAPATDKNKGVYIVRAAYEDQGANGLPALKSEQSFVLRNSKLDAHGFDEYVDINKMAFGGNNLAIPSKSGAYMVMKQVDLTGVSEIQVSATAPKPQLGAVGGTVEARLGSKSGALLGRSAFLEPSEKMDFTPKTISVPIQLPANLDSKLQDIYLVYSNPTAEGSLMVVMGVEFKLAYESSLKEPAKVETSSANDYFVGTWTTTIFGTPNGDVTFDMVFERNNGVLSGKMVSQQMGSQALEKLEEIDAEKIKLSFSANGMSISMELNKENADNLKGKVMGMLEVKGSRVK